MATVINERDVLLQAASTRTYASEADVALAAADAAQISANAANTALAAIFADNVLSRDEKTDLVLKWAAANSEYALITAQATALSVSYSAYQAAIEALAVYLSSLSPMWNDLTQNTAIVRTAANTAWNNYYAAKVALQIAIAAKTATMATGVTLSPTGALSGGGTSGQMTSIPTVDLNNGTVFGSRNRNDAPSEYPVGTTKQFKQSSSILLSGTSDLYCTLETIKQYADGSGGGVYQYAYAGSTTWRRSAPSAVGAVGTWVAWVQDLDRNAYTGDLNASSDISLVLSGSGLVLNGNSVTRTGGADWNASVRSRDGHTGGASCSAIIAPGSDVMFGLNTDPLTDDSYTSLDYAWYTGGNSVMHIYMSGTNVGTYGGTTTGIEVFGVLYDGSTVIFTKDGTVMLATTGPANAKFHFDSSLVNGTLKNIRFGPMSSNNWAAIGGGGKAADNATVGATIGTNLSGQITSANSTTFIGTAAIKTAQIEHLQTSNYAEDGSGNATAGARISSSSTDAIRVANGGLKVGSVYFTDYWMRIVQGIDGTVASPLIWRGNNDASTRGGAPNINCLTIYTMGSQLNGGDFQQVYFRTKITPTSYSAYNDNLDAMTQLKIQFFQATSSSNPFAVTYFPLASRTYDGATGASEGSLHWGWRSTTGPMLEFGSPYQYSGYIRASMANSYGWSATKDFGPVNTYGSALPSATITGTSGSSGGGGGGSGGACPAPWVYVRLNSGLSIPASQLYNGAVLQAVNDSTLERIPAGGTVQNLQTIWSSRFRVTLANGKKTEWSRGHRFATMDRGWINVEKLLPGDRILGLEEAIVAGIQNAGEGQVVSFTVHGAGTYFAGDMLCHNSKILP